MKRKLAALLAASLAVLTLFTGCGSSTGDSKGSDAGGKTELTLFWGPAASKEYTDYLNGLIGKFEKDNPDIKITMSLVSDPEGQTKQQMAAGGGPDLVNTDPTSMHAFASSDYLVSLDQYAEEYGWKDRFDQWVVDTLSYNESWYGLPQEMDGMVVYYNADMFQKNGWQIPETYEELVELCKEMQEKDIQPITFGCSDYKQANQWWVSEAFCAGLGQENLHKLLQGELDWTSDEVRDTVEKLASLWENNYIYKDSAAITLDEARSLFTNQNAGMYMSGTWEVSPLETAGTDFDWQVFQMPSWCEGVDSVLPVALGGSWSINAKCKNPDAAAKFLDFIYTPENVADMVKFSTLYPENGIDISNVDAPEKVKMLQNFVNESLDSGKVGYCAWTYWPVNTDTYAWNNIESVSMGQISVDEYLKNLQENFKLDQEKGNVLEF